MARAPAPSKKDTQVLLEQLVQRAIGVYASGKGRPTFLKIFAANFFYTSVVCPRAACLCSVRAMPRADDITVPVLQTRTRLRRGRRGRRGRRRRRGRRAGRRRRRGRGATVNDGIRCYARAYAAVNLAVLRNQDILVDGADVRGQAGGATVVGVNALEGSQIDTIADQCAAVGNLHVHSLSRNALSECGGTWRKSHASLENGASGKVHGHSAVLRSAVVRHVDGGASAWTDEVLLPQLPRPRRRCRSRRHRPARDGARAALFCLDTCIAMRQGKRRALLTRLLLPVRQGSRQAPELLPSTSVVRQGSSDVLLLLAVCFLLMSCQPQGQRLCYRCWRRAAI